MYFKSLSHEFRENVPSLYFDKVVKFFNFAILFVCISVLLLRKLQIQEMTLRISRLPVYEFSHVSILSSTECQK